MQQEVEARVKQEMLPLSAAAVQPFMGRLILLIHEVGNIVKAGVLARIVRFQEIAMQLFKMRIKRRQN